MEYEAIDDGRLGRILVPEGAQGIRVNEPIALLLAKGEDPSALEELTEAPTKAIPAVAPEPERAENSPVQAAPAAQPAPARGNGRIFASPLARRMAQQAGLDLGAITGSGPQGRVVKADIESALLAMRGAPAAAPPGPAARPQLAVAVAPTSLALSKERVLALAGNPPYTERPLTAMRRVIARRLTESKQTIPHFYLTVDCEIDELLKFRAELNAKSDAYRISVNDFVIRAAALALRQVPAANASWSDEAILLWDSVDVAVAVALDDGLITPIVKNADRKGLATIANETKDLAARARGGKLKLEEFQGGTFSISNLGMFGVRDFAAVINPPHGGILAVGAG